MGSQLSDFLTCYLVLFFVVCVISTVGIAKSVAEGHLCSLYSHDPQLAVSAMAMTRAMIGIYWAEARDTTQHPTAHRTAPHNDHPVPKVSCAEVAKSVSLPSPSSHPLPFTPPQPGPPRLCSRWG